MRLAQPELPARVRHSVPASAVPCIPPVPRPPRADVLPWAHARAWVRAPVGRHVPADCSAAPPERRLQALLRAPVLASELLPAALASVIRARAASRKAR